MTGSSLPDTERAQSAESGGLAAEGRRRGVSGRFGRCAVRLPQLRSVPLRRLRHDVCEMGELDAVRDAAADLLGLSLTVPGPANGWRPISGSSTWWRRRLVKRNCRRVRSPAAAGEAGRRRARAYLRPQTADLVPQQIGRARADLQYRLAEATRRLVRLVEARYTDSTGRLENALGQRRRCARPPQAKQRTRTRNSHNARKHWAGYSLCSTRPRPAPPRPAQPPGQA
jgi:hypothetical protein